MKVGKYQHSKTGNHYQVIGTAKHSETLEEYVIYECLYENNESKIWIRPKKMFEESVILNGRSVPRFRFIEE